MQPSRPVRARLTATVLALVVLSIASVALALREGARAPAIDADDTSGNRVSLSALRGSVVVVDFWGTYCEPCAAAMPTLQALHTSMAGRGVVVIGVSIDSRLDLIQRFVTRHHVTFPIVHDVDHRIAGLWDPGTMPTTFIIDRTGIVRHIHNGFRSGTAAQVRAHVEALLAD